MPQHHELDPWTRVVSRNGLAGDELISAFQKAIRRGEVESVARIAYECFATSEALEAKLWQRLMVSAVEDVGLARADAPVLVMSLFAAHAHFDYPEHDRFLLLLHAARALATGPKDRSTDELANWVKISADDDGVLPEIPDHALDVHTRRGQQMGRDIAHFVRESSRIEPDATTDATWRELLRARILGDG